MKKSILLSVALVALGGCVSHDFGEGRRTNWRCEGGKEFSMREVAGKVEVHASGQTHQLDSSGEDRYSNGEITYVVDGGRATLTGVYNGPFENCRGRAQNSWLPNLW